jgi:hypothetical protein
MSAIETIKAAYAAFGRNDPSVLFAAMDPGISWNEAEGNPLADRNPYVGPQAVGDGVFARLVAAIENFTAVPSTFIDGGDHVVVLGRYGGTMKSGGAPLDAPFCHVYRFHGEQGGDVPAVHRHRAVDAIADMTQRAGDSSSASVYIFRTAGAPGPGDRPKLFTGGHVDGENRHAAVIG